MAWLAVSKRGEEVIIESAPDRDKYGNWYFRDSVEGEVFDNYGIELPLGSIKKLIGHNLTWEDNPIEI